MKDEIQDAMIDLLKLQHRGDVVTEEENQHGSQADHSGDGKPFLTPKDIRALCLSKCSILKEPCAC